MCYWYKSGALLFLEGKQTSIGYLDILVDQAQSAMLHFHPDGNGHVMDDNPHVHRAKNVGNRLADHQSDF